VACGTRRAAALSPQEGPVTRSSHASHAPELALRFNQAADDGAGSLIACRNGWRWLRRGKRAHARMHAPRQRAEVIAAFEDQNDAAVGVSLCDIAEYRAQRR